MHALTDEPDVMGPSYATHYVNQTCDITRTKIYHHHKSTV